MALDTGKVRQFVKVSDGRIGVVMANETCGGVFRGHCDLWFGLWVSINQQGTRIIHETYSPDCAPLVEQLCVMEDWEEIVCPLGDTKCSQQ